MAIDRKKREAYVVIFAWIFLAIFIPFAIHKFIQGNAEYNTRYTIRKAYRIFRITSAAIDDFVKANGKLPIDAKGALSEELIKPVDYLEKAAKQQPSLGVDPAFLPPDPFTGSSRSARGKYATQKKYVMVIEDELLESDTPIRIYKCDFVPRKYVLVANGVDEKPDIAGEIPDRAYLTSKTYDPTNGAVSQGDYIN